VRYFLIRHLCIIVVCSFTAEGATYSGRVIDGGDPPGPVANATIAFKGSEVETYSDSAGRFSLTAGTHVSEEKRSGRRNGISFSNGNISFSCERRQTVRVEHVVVCVKGGVRFSARVLSTDVCQGHIAWCAGVGGMIPETAAGAAVVPFMDTRGQGMETDDRFADAHHHACNRTRFRRVPRERFGCGA